MMDWEEGHEPERYEYKLPWWANGFLWTLMVIVVVFLCWSTFAHANPQPAGPAPASIYAALQAQRNTCQDQAALASAASSEELAKVKAELASLKKDFGVQE